MNRGVSRGVAALFVALVLPTTSAAADDSLVQADQAVARSCASKLHPPQTTGVAHREWRSPAPGLFTARLEGGLEPDWDLALFRLPGERAAAASTSFASAEQASVWVKPGDRLAVQACRRHGNAASVPLALELFKTALPDRPTERFSLEQVSISEPQDLDRLEDLGLDVTHDVTPTSATVALYSNAERLRLAAAGFSSTTLVRDMAAADRVDRQAEALAESTALPSSLPSGRESYRVYEDYTSEMKALAESRPQLVRPLVLGTTFEGRPIEGIEIAADVTRTDDGRPVYMNLGLHHAREWPSGEFPIEFAHDLVTGFGENARITELLERVRVVIVPVVNVDGFLVSRTFGATPLDGNLIATLPLSLTDAAAYKRKNCRPPAPALETIPCVARPVAMGVDLNRNYGAYWGGVGSSTDPSSQSYRGTGPYSESESEAIHQLSSSVQPTMVVSNHTFTADGTWLRQPGFRVFGDTTPDEAAMKELGDAMAAATGWRSQLAWAIGQITGATEDWNYFAQGAYGYTPEAKGPNFHADYSTMVVDEYLGTGAHAGLGVREAFLRAGERAGNPPDHGVIEGTAPPGATLRLHKSFATPTCQTRCQSPTLFVDDFLDTRLEVGDAGSYEWHVNPSSRPLVAGELWTMSCRLPGGEEHSRTVSIGRGERLTIDWRGEPCGEQETENLPPSASFESSPAKPRTGEPVTFTSTSTDPDGTIASHEWDLDGDGEFDDAFGETASRSFASAGPHFVALRVVDDRGAAAVAEDRLVLRGRRP